MKKTDQIPKTRKPYEEIGAIFNGNEVKIRVPKTTAKHPKLTPSQLKLQQHCTCEDDRSICSETCGFPGQESGEGRRGNLLNIQVPDDICESLTHRTALNSELVYNKTEGHDPLCNVCNVTPKDAPKGVQAQKLLHPDKDVFILKIGKQTDEPNRTGNIEIEQLEEQLKTEFRRRLNVIRILGKVELVTPRAPAKLKPASHTCKQIQCEDDDFPCYLPCRTCRVPAPKKKKIKRRRCCL